MSEERISANTTYIKINGYKYPNFEMADVMQFFRKIAEYPGKSFGVFFAKTYALVGDSTFIVTTNYVCVNLGSLEQEEQEKVIKFIKNLVE